MVLLALPILAVAAEAQVLVMVVLKVVEAQVVLA